jgi:hypothetical protein
MVLWVADGHKMREITAAQKGALESVADILFFGGSAGWLKRKTMLVDAARESGNPNLRPIFFRQQFTQMTATKFCAFFQPCEMSSVVSLATSGERNFVQPLRLDRGKVERAPDRSEQSLRADPCGWIGPGNGKPDASNHEVDEPVLLWCVNEPGAAHPEAADPRNERMPGAGRVHI